MARMHSRKKGKSGSRRPIKKTPQTWVRYKSKEAELLIVKLAKEGNANIDEGHFSFSNLRTMANDLDTEFDKLSLRKKPTRPGKLINSHVAGGGVA